MVIIINIRKIFESIHTRLFVVFIIVAIVPLLLFSSTITSSFTKYYQNEVKTEIFRKANTIAINLISTGYFEGNREYLGTINSIVDGRAIIIDTDGLVTYDTNGIEEGKIYATEETLEAFKGEGAYYYSKEDNIGKYVTPIIQTTNKKVDGEDVVTNEIRGVVIVTHSFDSIATTTASLKGIAMLIVLALITVILVLSYFVSKLITKPFSLFIDYIEGVTEGHITEKHIIGGNYEIKQISNSFNHMINRLWEVEDNRQQFVSNVSHELKTPLSSIKVLAESLLIQEDVSPELYQEFLADINDEIDRETKIINDLLTLVTLDKKYELNISKVNINTLIESIMKRLKPLADKKNIEMIFESYRSVIAEIDETKFSLLMTNLIENAIKYNKDFGYINVSLNADHKMFKIGVKDTGIGIPDEYTEKIFQRFYRVDKTRSRETGGTGLGLSIVNKTVQMHHGTIRCESIIDKGTIFIVKTPLKYIL